MEALTSKFFVPLSRGTRKSHTYSEGSEVSLSDTQKAKKQYFRKVQYTRHHN